MHESLLVNELLDEVFRLARREAIGRITRIRVNLGEDGHISPESLRFHLQRDSQGSAAEEADFEIQATAGDSLFLVSCGRRVDSLAYEGSGGLRKTKVGSEEHEEA